MKKVLSLISSVAIASSMYGNSLDDVLKKVEIDSDLRVVNVGFNKKGSNPDTKVTAFGGFVRVGVPVNENIKIEIAPYFGHAFGELSGDKSKGEFEESVTSKDNSYVLLGEAVFKYANNDFALDIGRQSLDTPLMGGDDLRLTDHTFEGAMANYKLNSSAFYLGYFTNWQGFDAGLNDSEGKGFNRFQKLGSKDSDGTLLLGYEYDKSELNSRIYYYDIDKYSKVFYADGSYEKEFTEDITSSLAVQYSNQSEENNSNMEANLYGAKFELAYKKLSFLAAYTKSNLDDNKELFKGFGGDFYFTSMIEWSMGNQDAGEDEKAHLLSLGYDITDNIFVAVDQGRFKTTSSKVVETDFSFEYKFSDKLLAEAMYAKIKDKKDDNESYDNFIYRLTYSF